MNMVGPRAISRGHFTLANQIDDLLAVRFSELEAAAELASGFARLGQSGFGALADYRAFKFGEYANHLHHGAAGRAGGVEILAQRAEPGAGLADTFDDIEQVGE